MTLSAFVMGGSGLAYNVHLVARAMDSVASDEHRSTASAVASVRSIGTACGAAIAGVVANAARLGDATEPGGRQCSHRGLYVLLHTFGLTALLMFRFIRIALGKPEAVLSAGGGLAGAHGRCRSTGVRGERRHVLSASS